MLELRTFEARDLKTVAKIEQASRPTPWSLKQFESELSNSNSHPLVVLINGKVGGYIFPWHIADEIHIQNIVVSPTLRRKRLGELLLNSGLRQGIEAGCKMGILEVRESNIPAIRLYQSYKFETVGRRKNYYRDGENALLMNLGPFEDENEWRAYQLFIENRKFELKKTLKTQFE